ncbi:MAG: hypothetical protein K9G41_02040 [Flavobacteriales bacterium]|nr:hypothetical protein [Flavobacteriales bacterium]
MRWLLPFTFIWFLTVQLAALAQEGIPFMTDVQLGRQFTDSRIGSIVQTGDEAMFFSTSRGLLKYDGSTWERISTPSPVQRVYHHKPSNRIFVGLRQGAAEVVLSDSGTYAVKPIAGITTKQSVTHIIGSDNEVFFIGENEIHRLNPETKDAAKRYEFPEKLISGAFLYLGDLHLLFYQEGLFLWNEKGLKSVGSYEKLADHQMLFTFTTLEGTYVGFDSDALYRFSSGKFHQLPDHLRQYLSRNILSDGLLLNDSLLAFSTLAGGAVVVSAQTYNIIYRFDYSTGAKDNEIFCLGKDMGDGLWMAYDAGLSRIDLSQPVRNFSAYPGLDGNITASIVANGTLHVGTGNGVFVLKKATSRAEIDRMMESIIRKQQEAKEAQKPSFTPPEPAPKKKVVEEDEPQSLLERYKEDPAEVKEELSKQELRDLKKELRKQRKEERRGKTTAEVLDDLSAGNNEVEIEEVVLEEKDISTIEPTIEQGQNSNVINKPKPQAKSTVGVTDGAKNSGDAFLYRRIAGIDVKCRQLISIEGQVFAATNNGLYIIQDDRSSNLTPGVYINHVAVSNDGKKLLVATLNGVIELVKDNTNKWVSKSLNDTVRFIAYNVTQDANGHVWAGTDNGAYRYNAKGTKFYTLPDVLNERVLVSNVKGKMYFLLPSALFQLQTEKDEIQPATLAEVANEDRLEFMLGNNNMIWIKSNRGWSVLNGEAFAPMLPYLDLFEDIRHLSTDSKGNIYVIDKGVHVYSLQHRTSSAVKKFNIYIRQVVNSNGEPFSLQEMKIETDGDALIFNVSAPFYLKSQGTQYQYRIEGLKDNWSRWSEKTEIEPGIIPPGDYVLQVRARNILGEVSEIKSLEFTVPQRLFLRWYFLLLYFLILVLIVFIIIKSRERALKETQRILEEKVALRTAELEDEKVKTEELLLNILPKDTAQELQMYGKATARHYNQVSVLFTDFKGFTQFAENTKPEELVNELHRCFVRFDEIIGKYHLEKIKTIGDAYMCAGGVPIRNNSNAIAITLAALEIRDFMTEVIADKRSRNEPILEIRIGMHTGPLTAGVVGLKKFAYDIWGDTVNTASRMESSSEAGRINVSGTTYDLIKKYFDCDYRGQHEVKGKGMVEMYFVNAIKPEFSENKDGITPNKGLWELIN